MSYSFEFGQSVVREYNDFCINPDIPLFMQLDKLKEDLIQVEYDSGHILDIGWYPEFKLKVAGILYLFNNSINLSS